MREILTAHTTASGGGKLSVMYFDDAPEPGDQQAALQTMWATIYAQCVSSGSFKVSESGRTLSPTTGELLGFWTGDTTATTAGTRAEAPMPDAVQALIQWRTGVVVGGRLVQGRTFIPNLSSTRTQGGNLDSDARTAIQNGVASMVGALVGLGVYHRPGGATVGSLEPVVAGSVWNELAVLRRRRS